MCVCVCVCVCEFVCECVCVCVRPKHIQDLAIFFLLKTGSLWHTPDTKETYDIEAKEAYS